jgi:NAD(P)-dependent dehydrogenase (short-subunit alcohol dehydrogenase family)
MSETVAQGPSVAAGPRYDFVHTPMLDHLMEMGAAYFQEVSRLCGASTVFPGLDALDCRDVSEAVLWLASDAARYVTGIALPVDGGFTCK